MISSSDEDQYRNEYLFQHVVAMFQTLALQQLGKLVNPITGKAERDLQQAKITIDILQMIKEKTAGNLSDNERRILEHILIELQMNYVDESRHPVEREGEKEKEPVSKDLRSEASKAPVSAPKRKPAKGGRKTAASKGKRAKRSASKTKDKDE